MPGVAVNKRIDPAHDTRRLVLYFGGLIAFYGGVVVLGHPEWGGGEASLDKIAFGIMLAPTAGAVLATVFGPGVIRVGKVTWWILAGLLPAVVVLLVTLVAAGIGWVDVHVSDLGQILVLMVPFSILGSVSALGEEIGWRGFLWPLLRRRSSFLASTGVTYLVWWMYHAPMTLAGLYGTIGGLPAFSVALLGFVLFVGVLTERSRSIWPSVLSHGSWNALVATKFSTQGSSDHQMFTGSDALLGEFGWLAAITCWPSEQRSPGGTCAPPPPMAFPPRSQWATTCPSNGWRSAPRQRNWLPPDLGVFQIAASARPWSPRRERADRRIRARL